MHKIEIGHRKRSIPSHWGEVRFADWKRIAPVLYMDRPINQAAALTLSMLQIPLRDWVLMSQSIRDQLIDLCSWPLEKPLTHPLRSSFRLGFKRYYLPKPNLDNISIIEFAFAEIHFHALTQHFEIPTLLKLIACLARPSKPGAQVWLERNNLFSHQWNGDLRKQFTTEWVDSPGQFTRMPTDLALMIFHYYRGCREEAIFKRYEILWPTKEEKETTAKITLDATEPDKPYDPLDWLDLISSIAQTGQYGTYQQTLFTPAHTILFNLARTRAHQQSA